MARLPICLALIIALGGSTVSGQGVELRRSDNRVEVTRGTLSLVFGRGGRGFVTSIGGRFPYIETILVEDAPDDPTIHVVSIHDA